jgi:hypothetical protein
MRRLAPALLALLLLCACGDTTAVKADISAYGDTPITIAGLTDEEFTVTPNELAQLACVDRSAAGTTAKAGEVDAVGPLLSTFLAQYGKTQEDFKKIRFLASDDYRVVLAGQSLKDDEVILALSDGDDPLPEDYRPMRLMIPGAASSMWEYAVIRIEFETESGESSIRSVRRVYVGGRRRRPVSGRKEAFT